MPPNPPSKGRRAASARIPLKRYWRYRVGDYRIICDIQDAMLCVQVTTHWLSTAG
ncbi:type II toxin-antitoxin system RelE family toxin [Thiobacillus sp.]